MKLRHYDKILKCIRSCNTIEQLKSCFNLILAFRNKFLYNNNYSTYFRICYPESDEYYSSLVLELYRKSEEFNIQLSSSKYLFI